jgi:hypothetical protein
VTLLIIGPVFREGKRRVRDMQSFGEVSEVENVVSVGDENERKRAGSLRTARFQIKSGCPGLTL